ncbi:hypothetical protein ACEN9F_13520 [Duganella sp. CT11-25]|uniref:hypothetical protein n=1 Tax=unclassified Duganella TaxID=2636909 RepID=UPI0039AFFBCB
MMAFKVVLLLIDVVCGRAFVVQLAGLPSRLPAALAVGHAADHDRKRRVAHGLLEREIQKPAGAPRALQLLIRVRGHGHGLEAVAVHVQRFASRRLEGRALAAIEAEKVKNGSHF